MESQKKSSKDAILEKAIANIEGSDLYVGLSRARGEHLQALLLNVFSDRVDKIKVSDVIRQANNSRFLTVPEISQRDLVGLDSIFFKVMLDDVKTFEFSPVGPLGMNSTFTKINSKNTISTIRNNELVSDASILLVLEYVKSRTVQPEGPVHLFTSHRIVRAQKFDIEGFTSHFRAGFMLSADKFLGRWELLAQFLERHIDFYLSALKTAVEEGGYHAHNITVSMSNLVILERIIEDYDLDRNVVMRNTQTHEFSFFDNNDIHLPKTINCDENLSDNDLEKFKIGKSFGYLKRNTFEVLKSLKSRYPNVDFVFDLERVAGIGYYDNLCFKITATNSDEETYPLCDGGFTDWTKQAMYSDKEICLSSGFGSELFISKFKVK